jgi:hypothetical protein
LRVSDLSGLAALVMGRDPSLREGPFPDCRKRAGTRDEQKKGLPQMDTTTFDIDAMPPLSVGAVVTKGAQEFRCVEIEPYVRVDGEESAIAVIEARCATCGEWFRFKAARAVFSWKKASVVQRRCEAHRKRGKKIHENEMTRYWGVA